MLIAILVCLGTALDNFCIDGIIWRSSVARVFAVSSVDLWGIGFCGRCKRSGGPLSIISVDTMFSAKFERKHNIISIVLQEVFLNFQTISVYLEFSENDEL